MKAILALAVLLGACATTGPSASRVRFANAPPVTVVDDRRDVPTPPHRRTLVRYLFHLDAQIHNPLLRALELPIPQRALGVNALDEVPDSTWFTNRIGVRDIRPDELRAAPGGVGSPEPHRPWTIESTKVGGMSVGFIVRDARGERWLLKFDARGFPEMETAAHVIVGKLLWAAGYNVTEDYIVYFRSEDLVLAPDAVSKDVFGHKRPLDQATVTAHLGRVEVEADGRIRGLASRMLAGEALGGHPEQGVRRDDPNDRIPHERRRDLRGAHTLFAWLDHEDLQGGNYLDMWVEDPAKPGHHYVKHYFIDFGKSLGVMTTIGANPRRGSEFYIDPSEMLEALLTLGAHERDWERRDLVPPRIRGVAMFETTTFDPGGWKAASPAYVPFLTADKYDKFWGAKLVMRFTREQLVAAVEAGRFSDPRAVQYIVDALVTRQRKIGRYWFKQVAPLDRFSFGPEGLCFDDLALEYGLVAPGMPTRYQLTSHDDDDRALAPTAAIGPGLTGHTCHLVPTVDTGDGYTIVKIVTERIGYTGTTYVHLARDPQRGVPRVIGVWRP